jgi:ketosteroid isomerase-like protein
MATAHLRGGELRGEILARVNRPEPHESDAGELVRSIYARWQARQNALELMADDVVWDFSRRQVEPEVYRGHEGVLTFIHQLFEGWSALRNEPSEFISIGDRVLVLLAIKGTGRSTGLEVVEQIAHLWTVNDGKATRLEYFGDVAQARRALEASS